jgi:methylenetetrahydrofolate reductase (NADPH)
LSIPDAPAHAQQPGRLETRLRSGQRALVVEARPPDSPDLAPLLAAARRLGDAVDAIQLTDMPFATPHVANLAAGAALRQAGHEVVLNVSCRDRNSIAQQGTLLGAAALGIQNVFCIRGDDPRFGDHPQARGVFEMSGLELIALARGLRDDAAYASGRPLSVAPAFFIGAALAPHARYGDGAQALASRKVAAGADFLVTQPLFDQHTLPRFLTDAGSTLDDCFVLAGLGAATKLETLSALTASDEVHVPAEFIEQLRAAPTNARRLQLGIDHVLVIAEQALASGASGVLVYPFDCGVEETLTLCEALRPLLANQRTSETA